MKSLNDAVHRMKYLYAATARALQNDRIENSQGAVLNDDYEKG